MNKIRISKISTTDLEIINKRVVDNDFKYPDGLDGDIISQLVGPSIPYTVPIGKNYYILSSYGTMAIDGSYFDIPSGKPYIAKPGQIISKSSNAIMNGYFC